MSDQASTIAREAKVLHQNLRDLLKNRDPWERDVEFKRKQLRRQHLLLLLCHPYAKESQDSENHLWMQTSYAFISVYKQRIASLDKLLQSSSRQQQQAKGGHGPVEHRKLVQRFRQFLAEEEKFWIQFIARFQRAFKLTEAKIGLITLGILASTTSLSDDGNPDVETTSNAGQSNGRHRSQLPAEDDTLAQSPPTPALREGRLAMLSKAIVRLGDIARYRELYNESGGRPRAGQEDGGPSRRGGQSKRGGIPGLESIVRPRSYDRAEKCYELAKQILPDDGNASNQLAILATYQKDVFNSLVHYFRALCVANPYEMASENMGTVLSKALEAWKSKKESNSDTNGALPPRVRIEVLKDDMIALLAVFRLGSDKMDSIAPSLSQTIVKEFSALVSERHLPIDMISRFIVLCESALWKHCMLSLPNHTQENGRSDSSSSKLESRIFAHLLAMHQALLEIGAVEIEEPPPKDATENDFAQKITATFRRTLPALRIASKWIRANLRYVMQMQDSEQALSSPTQLTADFWNAYARFCCVLARSFPVSQLPTNVVMLDEDVEMSGFLPLKKLMGDAESSDGNTREASLRETQEQVHPNVEQLMRIADLLTDSHKIATIENSPIAPYDSLSTLRLSDNDEDHIVGRERAAIVVPVQTMVTLAAICDDKASETIRIDEDTMTEATSRTDDDPVRDAFRKALNGCDRDSELAEDDEDEIVWNIRQPVTPVMSSVISPPRLTPLTPVKPPPVTPKANAHSLSHLHGSFSTFTSTMPQQTVPTTALDLLNNVMGNNRANNDFSRFNRPPVDLTPVRKPQLLFGPGLVNQKRSSIWSLPNSVEWSNNGTGHAAAQVPQTSMRSPLMQTHDPWAVPSYSDATYIPQHSVARGLPSPSFATSSHLMNLGNHQRSLSTSTPGYFNNLPPIGHGLEQNSQGYSSLLPPASRNPISMKSFDPIGLPNNGFGYQLPHPSAMQELTHHARHLSLSGSASRPPQSFVPTLSPSWANPG